MSTISPTNTWSLQGRSKLVKNTIHVTYSESQTSYLKCIKNISSKVFQNEEIMKLYNAFYKSYSNDTKPTLKTLENPEYVDFSLDVVDADLTISEYFSIKQATVNNINY